MQDCFIYKTSCSTFHLNLRGSQVCQLVPEYRLPVAANHKPNKASHPPSIGENSQSVRVFICHGFEMA